MKKIALLLCAIVMFGCSDDEEKAGTEVPDPEISKMLFSEFASLMESEYLTLLKRKSFTTKMPG